MTQSALLLVRSVREEDLPRALEIYAIARVFMHENGNPTQWADWYPSEEILRNDIAHNALYCIFDAEHPHRICGMFTLLDGDDPTYAELFEGAWLDDSSYGTIHRIASDGTHSGIFETAVQFARTTHHHLRIDTHRDNMPMQRCIKRWGFSYCGIIYIEDGTPRVAFEWIREGEQ